MEEKENALPAGAVHGADARTDEGTAAPYGKFKDAGALLQAYNSLEAEFTRRSQRLRELEGKLAAGREGQESSLPPKSRGEGGAGASAERQAAEQGAAFRTAEQGADSAERHAAALEEAAARAVEAYFAAHAAPAPPVLAGGGTFTPAPVRRVRTFGEAGELARELFRKNGN